MAINVVKVGTETLETLNQVDSGSIDGRGIASLDVGRRSGRNAESEEGQGSIGELHCDDDVDLEIY